MSTWLVTGGAGYIGAHVVRTLLDGGDDVVVLDDLSTGRADRVPQAATLVKGDIGDREVVRRTVREFGVAGIVHIAAKKQVGESVEQPMLYYRDNVVATQVLLDEAVAAGVGSFVFSSSAATYGMPDVDLVDEDTPTRPLSPYGTTKLVGEWMSRDVAEATGLRVLALRYFNVAGAATPELSDPATLNLIPLVFRELTSGSRPKVFGADYPTPDGTCVRDYIDVRDVAEVHAAGLRQLAADPDGPRFRVYNIGRGEGSSVLEVLDVIGAVTGFDMTPEIVGRRPGDPARIVGGVERVKRDLGWSARYELREMVESAWAGWQQRG